MFENLSDRLQDIFSGMRNKGSLTERDVDTAMREIRMALLEADVNFKVVKDFVARVKERSVGAEVLQSLTPAQQVVKIVHEELQNVLGEPARLDLPNTPPGIILLAGLQGAGKTTTAAKLAHTLRKAGQHPLLVALDVYRPAAIDQLISLGKQLNIAVYSEGTKANPVNVARNAIEHARKNLYTVVILDTAGRLHVDPAMMNELQEIQRRVQPHEVLLVADAMTGQDAVHAAAEFNESVPLTGLVLTKMDGDARGGAALSIRAVTGVPIKYMGMGEKTDALEVFHPDRLAQRILGMGDVLSLIERVQQNVTEEETKNLEKRMRAGQMDFEDFLKQLNMVRKMMSGQGLAGLIGMIPGMRQMMRQIGDLNVDESHFKYVEAMIQSMTVEERRNPKLIDGSRRKRIARGSGRTVQDVNELLKAREEMQKMVKQMGLLAGGGKKGKKGKKARVPKGLMGL